MGHPFGRALAAWAALAALAAPAAAEEAPPPREGAVVGWQELLALRALFPPEIWRHRDVFFHPGMRMEIGPSDRDYPAPEAFRRATARGTGRARLDAEGNLSGHVPGEGLPFPPGSIDPAAPDAALRWAWSFERRHRGAGPRGSFRLVDLPSRVGGAQVYTGEWFQLVAPPGGEASFAAGGRFHAPSPVRHLAWRQLRPLSVAASWRAPDEVFVYLPSARKVRRAAGAWSDGLFTPSYRASATPAAPAATTSGAALAATGPMRRGWLGLSIRPNAYRWRLVGEREVLAPLNAARSGYPLAPERDWGESGLSAADDRWERRRAVVIEGALREGGRGYDQLTLTIDARTLQPLYYATRTREGRVVDAGILIHRWSGDVPGYPPGPGGAAPSVFDPVAAVFVHGADGGSGWRRESYDVVSSLPSDAERARLASPEYLDRGR